MHIINVIINCKINLQFLHGFLNLFYDKITKWKVKYGYVKSPIFFISGGNWLIGLGFSLSAFISSGFLLFSSELFLLASDGFNISGNEKINHLVPFLIEWNLTSESHDFSGQHPENHSDRLWYSIVAWNDDINEVQWGVSVAKSNGWNVDI